jgi:hypothetical protein
MERTFVNFRKSESWTANNPAQATSGPFALIHSKSCLSSNSSDQWRNRVNDLVQCELFLFGFLLRSVSAAPFSIFPWIEGSPGSCPCDRGLRAGLGRIPQARNRPSSYRSPSRAIVSINWAFYWSGRRSRGVVSICRIRCRCSCSTHTATKISTYFYWWYNSVSEVAWREFDDLSLIWSFSDSFWYVGGELNHSPGNISTFWIFFVSSGCPGWAHRDKTRNCRLRRGSHCKIRRS